VEAFEFEPDLERFRAAEPATRAAAWRELGEICEAAEAASCERVWSVVAALAAAERAEEVGRELVQALGRLQVEAATPVVLGWCSASDPTIRREVTSALVFTSPDPPPEAVIAALVALSADPDGSVRDWGTFALGSMFEIESVAIEDALIARLNDEHVDCREEAIVGLAERRDARALEPTRLALEAESVGRLAVEAAVHLGDPTLLPALRELREWWDVDPGLLEQAIERCEANAANPLRVDFPVLAFDPEGHLTVVQAEALDEMAVEVSDVEELSGRAFDASGFRCELTREGRSSVVVRSLGGLPGGRELLRLLAAEPRGWLALTASDFDRLDLTSLVKIVVAERSKRR
jgi:hypothetical protein